MIGHPTWRPQLEPIRHSARSRRGRRRCRAAGSVRRIERAEVVRDCPRRSGGSPPGSTSGSPPARLDVLVDHLERFVRVRGRVRLGQPLDVLELAVGLAFLGPQREGKVAFRQGGRGSRRGGAAAGCRAAGGCHACGGLAAPPGAAPCRRRPNRPRPRWPGPPRATRVAIRSSSSGCSSSVGRVPPRCRWNRRRLPAAACRCRAVAGISIPGQAPDRPQVKGPSTSCRLGGAGPVEPRTISRVWGPGLLGGGEIRSLDDGQQDAHRAPRPCGGSAGARWSGAGSCAVRGRGRRSRRPSGLAGVEAESRSRAWRRSPSRPSSQAARRAEAVLQRASGRPAALDARGATTTARPQVHLVGRQGLPIAAQPAARGRLPVRSAWSGAARRRRPGFAVAEPEEVLRGGTRAALVVDRRSTPKSGRALESTTRAGRRPHDLLDLGMGCSEAHRDHAVHGRPADRPREGSHKSGEMKWSA